jgi:hypothetical protein
MWTTKQLSNVSKNGKSRWENHYKFQFGKLKVNKEGKIHQFSDAGVQRKHHFMKWIGLGKAP